MSSERKNEERRLGLGAECFLPAADLFVRLEAMVFEQAGEALAGAAGVAGENDRVAAPAQVGDVLGDGFVDVRLLGSLGCEIACWLDTEVEHAV